MRNSIKKSTALVVDDEQIMRDLLKRSLTRSGWVVTVADGGLSALQELERREFDVLITDVKMPQMDGLTLVQEARKLYPHLPSLLITGYSDGLSAATARKLGVVDLIVKPFKNTVIVQTLGKALMARKFSEATAAVRAARAKSEE